MWYTDTNFVLWANAFPAVFGRGEPKIYGEQITGRPVYDRTDDAREYG